MRERPRCRKQIEAMLVKYPGLTLTRIANDKSVHHLPDAELQKIWCPSCFFTDGVRAQARKMLKERGDERACI